MCEARGRRLTPEEIGGFQGVVYANHAVNYRSFPWRQTSDPYCILVSEIMLQQTRTRRVEEKYPGFIRAFPDFHALAKATLEAVLNVWQGLGYNRRGLALHRIARIVANSYGGELPTSPETLRTLPGIGAYTACAIVAFAFNLPTVFIETNVRSVFLHHFFRGSEGVRDREILPLVEWTLDRANPRVWYYALMDYGSSLKSEVNPSRRSAHHRRQAPFEGSNRQVRSAILREVLRSPGIRVAWLKQRLGLSVERVERNLEALQREGFLTVDEQNRLLVGRPAPGLLHCNSRG